MKHLPATVALLLLFVSANYLPWLLEHPGFVADDFYQIAAAIEHPFPLFFADVALEHNVQFRPLVMLSYHLDYLVAGTNPSWYIGVNILLAIAGMMAFFMVMKEFLAKNLPTTPLRDIALISAVLLLHADMFYSVLWISQRTESMMLLFYALALWCWLRYLHEHRARHYIGFIALYLLCLLSKSSGVHLPLIAGVFFFWYRRQSDGAWFRARRRWLELLLPLVVMVSYVAVITYFDPTARMLPLEYLVKKPFSVAGLFLISLYTPVAEAVYNHISYSGLYSAVFLLLLAVGAAIFYFRVKAARNMFMLLASVFLLSLFPRIMAATSERINSIQTFWVLFAVLLLLVTTIRSARLRTALLTIVLLAHIVALHRAIPAWYATSEKEQYADVVSAYRSGGISGSTLVFSELPAMDLYPWIMHFRRFGSFGYDSSAMRSGLGYVRQFGSRTIRPELSQEDVCFTAVSTDRRNRIERLSLLRDNTVDIMYDEQGNLSSDVTAGSVCVNRKRERWAYIVR